MTNEDWKKDAPPMPEPAVLKTPDGEGYSDDTGTKWAWFAHGYDTGMEPFFSADQLREYVESVVAHLQQRPLTEECEPSIDRDDRDGELLIDWSPKAGRMLTLSLREDGRLSYAFHWDGEKAHGTAQMPVGGRPLPVREGTDKQLPLAPTSHMLNASVNAWHSWKARDTGGCIQTLGRLMWEHMADAAPNAGDWDGSPSLPVREEPTGLASFVRAQDLAQSFHEAYERLAPSFGYTTRPETRTLDLQSANGRLMVAVCQELLASSPSVQNSTNGVDLPDGAKNG